MSYFGNQAATFATRREDHARIQANIAERVEDLGREGARMAGTLLVLGYGDVVLDLMLSVLDEQMAMLKIRLLEAVCTDNARPALLPRSPS